MLTSSAGTSHGVWNAVLPDPDCAEQSISQALAKGPVLLGIYKSSCAASKVMMPVLQRIALRHQSDGLTTLGVSQDSANITRSFARRYKIEFPILVEAPDFPVSNGLDIHYTPTVFVLSRDGAITYTTMGFLRGQVEEIEAAVAAELGVASLTIISPDEADIPFFVPG